jgi:hypothetical protein
MFYAISSLCYTTSAWNVSSRETQLADTSGWTLFDRKSQPKTNAPRVTLQAAGTFSMNEAAFEALGRPAQVEMLYHEGEQLVGFRPAGEESAHSYPIKPQQNARTFQTGGRAFCSAFGIETGTARRFAAKVESGLLVIDLKDEAKNVSKPRRR